MEKMVKNNEIEYRAGNLGRMIEVLAKTFNEQPDYIMAVLRSNFPEMADKSACPNCGANMEISLYRPDILDALLMLEIARSVREKILKGVPFTEANITHTTTLPTTLAIRCRTTRCYYFGYLVQPKDMKNSGNWVITSWGWQLIMGKPVPAAARWFRGQLVDRKDETITLTEMMGRHVEEVAEATRRGKSARSDYSLQASKYNPNDWREFEGYAQGNLF